jgi:hypothetical protein
VGRIDCAEMDCPPVRPLKASEGTRPVIGPKSNTTIIFMCIGWKLASFPPADQRRRHNIGSSS